jgi:DNA mismatch endonuclease Vsr
MDNLSKEHRRKNMRAVKSHGSKIETALAKALWAKGLRYRKNDKTVFGKPDFTFKKRKIAIFVDSEFWHGKEWESRKLDIKSNQEFWYAKIEKNIARDRYVSDYLLHRGWKIIRFWGEDIKKDLSACVDAVTNAINDARFLDK